MAERARSPPGAGQVGMERHHTPDPDHRKRSRLKRAGGPARIQRESGAIRWRIGGERHAGRRIVRVQHRSVPADQGNRDDDAVAFDDRAGHHAVAMPTPIGVQGITLTCIICRSCIRQCSRGNVACVVTNGQTVKIHGRQQDETNSKCDRDTANVAAQQDVPGTRHAVSGR